MSTNHDELEQMLGRDLHQQVDGMSTVPFGFSEVQGRAHRIRRNRRIAAGLGLAAAVAVIVPVGLNAGGTLQSRDDVQPAPSPAAPTEAFRTPLTVNGLPHGHAPEIEYFTEDGVVLPGEGTQQLPESYQALVPSSAAGGWIALGPNREEVIYLSEEFERLGSSPASGYGFATTPERDYVSWVIPENGVQTLQVRSTTDFDAMTSWELPGSPAAGPVGILSPDWVVYETESRTGSGTKVGLANPDGTTTELPYLNALGVDPVNGLISVQTSSTDNTGCFAVVEAATPMEPAWETCDYKLGAFNPSGTMVMAVPADSDGLGPTMVSMLDAQTGELRAEFASAGRNQVTLLGPAWEDGSTIVATAMEGTTSIMVRMRVDGLLEKVAESLDAGEYGDVPYFIGDNRTSL